MISLHAVNLVYYRNTGRTVQGRVGVLTLGSVPSQPPLLTLIAVLDSAGSTRLFLSDVIFLVKLPVYFIFVSSKVRYVAT